MLRSLLVPFHGLAAVLRNAEPPAVYLTEMPLGSPVTPLRSLEKPFKRLLVILRRVSSHIYFTNPAHGFCVAARSSNPVPSDSLIAIICVTAKHLQYFNIAMLRCHPEPFAILIAIRCFINKPLLCLSIAMLRRGAVPFKIL